jgi:hypothetical protein
VADSAQTLTAITARRYVKPNNSKSAEGRLVSKLWKSPNNLPLRSECISSSLIALKMGAERSFALPDATWTVAEKSLPKTGTLVKYRTAFYQMLGYLDVSGQWVALDGCEETLPVQAWRLVHQPVSTWPERLA